MSVSCPHRHLKAPLVPLTSLHSPCLSPPNRAVSALRHLLYAEASFAYRQTVQQVAQSQLIVHTQRLTGARHAPHVQETPTAPQMPMTARWMHRRKTACDGDGFPLGKLRGFWGWMVAMAAQQCMCKYLLPQGWTLHVVKMGNSRACIFYHNKKNRH